MYTKKLYEDIYNYIQGNIRYQLFYSKYFRWLIRDFILDQIEFRIKVMNKTCYNNGTCVECGCKTTALQMCDKACEGNCYPAMMAERAWNSLKAPYKHMFESNPELYYKTIKEVNS